MTMNHFTFARALLRWIADHQRITGLEYVELMKAINRDEREFVGCRSKEQFSTFGAAQKVVRSKYIDKQREMGIYPCRVCHQFHIGGRSTLRRKERISIRQKRESSYA